MDGFSPQGARPQQRNFTSPHRSPHRSPHHQQHDLQSVLALPTSEPARVGDHLFEQLEQAIAAGSFSGDYQKSLLTQLHFVYGKNFGKALDIVNKNGVECYQAQNSGRWFCKVEGQSGQQPQRYLVFPGHYCTCPAFHFEVASRSESLCCKHQLAARVALALRRCRYIEVSDLQLASELLGARNS